MEQQTLEEREFVTVINQYRSIIYKVCYNFVSNRDEVDDLYQEIVINLWQGFRQYRGEGFLSSWIYRISLNTCISCYRRTSNQPKMIQLCDNMEIEDTYDRYWQLKELYKMVDSLESKERSIILLWLDNKSYEEIAQLMCAKRSTISGKLKKIKDKIIAMANK